MIDHITRHLSSDDETNEDAIFNVAIATIFAREVLEGAVIIGQYRTAVIKNDKMTEEEKSERLRAITISASIASFVAILVVLAVAIPLGILSGELDERVVEIIEGVSKIVAAICIIQLSCKLPEWLGLYRKVSIFYPWKPFNPEKEKAKKVNITIKEIRFNVAWNIWREVAECGVFLIPFFLGTGAKAIPLSAVVGTAISLVLGIGIYIANNRMSSKFWLAIVMSGLTLFLSVGLFVGGAHEFEEVWGETQKVYVIENPNASSKTLPMAILKPFGYSSSRTVLQICCFWIWLALGCLLHFRKWRITQQLNELYPIDNENDDGDNDQEANDAEKAVEDTARDSKLEVGSSGSDTEKKPVDEENPTSS